MGKSSSKSRRSGSDPGPTPELGPPPPRDVEAPPLTPEAGEQVTGHPLDAEYASVFREAQRQGLSAEALLDTMREMALADSGMGELGQPAMPPPERYAPPSESAYPSEWDQIAIEIRTIPLMRFLPLLRRLSRSIYTIASRGTHVGSGDELIDAVRRILQIVCKQTPEQVYCEWGAGCLPTPTREELGIPDPTAAIHHRWVRGRRVAPRAVATTAPPAARPTATGREGRQHDAYPPIGMSPDGRQV